MAATTRIEQPAATLPPPYFDSVAERAELTALNARFGDDERALREAILKRLKTLGAEARLHAEREFREAMDAARAEIGSNANPRPR